MLDSISVFQPAAVKVCSKQLNRGGDLHQLLTAPKEVFQQSGFARVYKNLSQVLASMTLKAVAQEPCKDSF